MNIIQGDCLEKMKEMNNNSVDVVITSPPYFTSNRNASKLETINSERKMNLYDTKYIHAEHFDDYEKFLYDRIDEMLRVSRNLVLINFQPVINSKKYFYRMIGRYSEQIYDMFTWVKTVSQPQSHKHYMSRYTEFVMILTKTGKVQVTSPHLKNYYIGNPNTTNKFVDIHGAVMEYNFCKKLVYEFSRKGDIVLDPFSGMGTTGCACKVLDREYIGIELEPIYVEKSIERINNHTEQMNILDLIKDKENDLH